MTLFRPLLALKASDIVQIQGSWKLHIVEHAFNDAFEQMHVGPLSWVPSFFAQQEYMLFTEGDAVSYIRLPHGCYRRNTKLHCESDVKCLLCDRYTATPSDLPRLQEMRERFVALGLQLKADVVAAQIRRLEEQALGTVIPLHPVATASDQCVSE